MGIRGVLLDVDGTLIDSNTAHAQAWVDALNEFGITVTLDQVLPLIGMGGDNLLPAIAGLDKDDHPGKQIALRRGEIFKERYQAGIQPLPGVRDLIERLRADGLKLVVATSAQSDEVDHLLAIAGVDDLVDKTTTSDDAENSKPDPDIIQAALKRGGLAAHEAIMIGDTEYDIEAARKAGVDTIAFRSGGHGDKLAGALAVYDDPADLVAHYAESPLGQRGK